MFEIDHIENLPIAISYEMDKKTYLDLTNALELCDNMSTKIEIYERVREFVYYDYDYESKEAIKQHTYTLRQLGGVNADLTRFDEMTIRFDDEDANTSLTLVKDNAKARLDVHTSDLNFNLGTFFQRKTHGKFNSELLPDSPAKIRNESDTIPNHVLKMLPTFWIPCNSQSVADFEDKAYWRLERQIGIIRTYRESGADSSLEYIIPSLRFFDRNFVRIFWDSQHPSPTGTPWLFIKKHPRLGAVRECSWDFNQHLSKQEIQKYDDFINGVCYLAN